MTAYRPLRPGDPLPEGWRWVRLGDACVINPPRPRIQRGDDELTTFVPMSSVDENTGTIACPELKPYRQLRRGYTYFEEGDVLFAKITPSMENGKAAIARNLTGSIGFGSTEFHVLRPTELVLAEWVLYFIRRKSFRQEAKQAFRGSAGQQRVPAEFLKEYPIALPPLEVQRRIVAWLDEAFSHLRAIKEHQAEAEREADALMSSKLTEVFSRAEREGWRWVKLGDVAEIASGGTPRRSVPAYWGGNIPWVKISDIPNSGIVAQTEESITEEGLRNSSAKLFPPGTILFSIFATIGKVGLLKIQAATNQALAGVRVKVSHTIKLSYLFHTLRWLGKELAHEGRGMAQSNINLTILRNATFPLPPLEVQRRIVEEIEAFEKEVRRIKEGLKESRDILEKLEGAILTEAFRPERWS